MKIALAGNPNSGKTSLFNALTGLNQQVGNYPGITVDKKSGYFTHKNIEFTVIDIPGTYSVNPKSEDERVALSIVNDSSNSDYPDVIIYVADATNLKRSLLFFSQLADTKIPIVLGLNMIDLANKANLTIKTDLLSEKLGIPVVELNAREEVGLDELKDILFECSNQTKETKQFIEDFECLESYNEELRARYFKINKILNGVINQKNKLHPTLSRLDSILTHGFFGYLVFVMILLIIFQSVFSLAEYPMGWIELAFEFISLQIDTFLPDGVLKDLVVNGIIAGLGGVIIFIPQIALLFFFIGILEDSGYMARVSFLLDRVLRKFGLHGKSVIPLMSGVACAIPAVMSARTIGNSKERLITILVTPLITCAARLPVYVLIISLIIPNNYLLGIFSYQGIALTVMYLLGFIVALGVAWVLKLFLKTEEKSYFVLEMPSYKMPRWKNIVLTIYEKVKVFVLDAGKIIVAISILLWLFSSYGPRDIFEKLEQRYELGEIDQTELASSKLEASYVGILGKSIEPAIAPLGFDWKIGISLITSFAAREVFVGSMATIYSVEDQEDMGGIREKMLRATYGNSDKKIYTLGVGLALLVFYAFAMQCMSTIAIVYRETKSFKWTFIQAFYMTSLAYFFAMLTYQIWG